MQSNEKTASEFSSACLSAWTFSESGETIVFQGVNVRDPHNLEKEGHWTKSHFEQAKAWGANVIRLPIHPPSWRARGEEGYLILIDQAVGWAGELGRVEEDQRRNHSGDPGNTPRIGDWSCRF